jgi:hypothetical protein
MERVSAENFQNVAWDSGSSTGNMNNWIVKKATGVCGANAILYQKKQRPDDKCLFCGNKETVLHVCKCQHAEVVNTWGKVIYDLEIYLIGQYTGPGIVRQLTEGLLQWQKGQEYSNEQHVQGETLIG